MKSAAIVQAALLSLLLTPRLGVAQSSRELPLDAHTAAMGQTGVAGWAGSGTAVLNPAGLARVEGLTLDLGTTASWVRGGKLAVVEAPEAGGFSVGDTPRLSDASWLPTSLGVAQSFGWESRLVLGLSGALVRDDAGKVASSRQGLDAGLSTSDRFEREFHWQRVLVGPSAAIAFDELGLRFGASLFGGFSEMSSHVYLLEDVSADTGIARSSWSEVDDRRQVIDLSAVFGLGWDPLDALSLGASFRTGPLAVLSRSGTIHRVQRQIDAAGGGGTFSDAAIDGASVPEPSELRLGLGWAPADRIRIAFDVSYLFMIGGTSLGTADAGVADLAGNTPPEVSLLRLEERLSIREVVNFAAGVSVLLDERWSVGAGFLTDRALTGADRSATTEDGRTIAWVRWPKRDHYLGTLGASFADGPLILSAGLALGAVLYKSSDILLAGGAPDSTSGLVARVSLSAGLRLAP